MNKRINVLLSVLVSLGAPGRVAGGTGLGAELPRLSSTNGQAAAWTEGDQLVVTTGAVERRWRWTGHGLVTTGLKDLKTGHEWVGHPPTVQCDWSYPGLIDDATRAKFVSLTAQEDDDQGFTSKHLAVTAEMEYPQAGLTVRYVVWAYPGAPGLRSQLWVKGRAREDSGAAPADGDRRVDYVPVSPEGPRRRAMGYYNDTQHRNRPDTPVLRDEATTNATVSWASVLALETDDAGLAMVKESHKCVNQAGVDTGLFRLDKNGLQNTGWSLERREMDSVKFQWCWASWVTCYDGTEIGRELALKQFDRLRYPVKPERDLWSVVCTWGESRSARDGRNHATEKEVLKELPLTKELGADLLLIDDGWQVSGRSKSSTPDGGIGWKPSPSEYPQGWSNVVAQMDKLGLRAGLWGEAQRMPVADMEWNFDRLGMSQLKLDFARLGNHEALDEVTRKARAFLLYNHQRCILSWDTTENAARYGYWWAREYGDMHFMNRKPETPVNVVYVPWLALRDFWLLAKYQNLNKWQLVIQNSERVNQKISNAWRYSPAYCTATALMGIPEFMSLPRSYSAPARRDVRALMDTWKQCRQTIFTGYVFPVGDEPSDGSWTGFQSWSPDGRGGYLTLFRELNNPQTSRRVALRLVRAQRLKLTDLETGQTRYVSTGSDGSVSFTIARAAGFAFIKYEILGS